MTYLCGVCDSSFNTNEEAIHHMKDVHPSPPLPPGQQSVETEGLEEPVEEKEDEEGEENVSTEDNTYDADLNVENDVMEEAAQDQDIYEELVKITQVVIHPE